MGRNSTLRFEARNSLSSQLGISIVIYFIYALLTSTSAIPLVGGIFSILLTIPLSYSMSILFLKVARGEEVEIFDLFNGFKRYEPVLTTMLITYIYVILWSLLFIIPGIIKGCSYAMTPYIVADMGLKNDMAIAESKRMMRGHKMRLFLMDLGFWGLSILSIITLGILLLYIIPYWQTSRAKFYMDLRGE